MPPIAILELKLEMPPIQKRRPVPEMPVTHEELDDLQAELLWLRHLLEEAREEVKQAEKERKDEDESETLQIFEVTISVKRRRT